MVSHAELQERHKNLHSVRMQILQRMEALQGEQAKLQTVLVEVEGSLKLIASLEESSAKDEAERPDCCPPGDCGSTACEVEECTASE